MRMLTTLLWSIVATVAMQAQEIPFWQQTNGPVGSAQPGIPKALPDGRLFINLSRIGGVFCSDDTGRTFRLCNSGVSQEQVTYLLANSSTVFITTPYALYRSDDRGETWHRTDGDFPPGAQHHFMVLSSYSGTVFAMFGSPAGASMMRSSDGGESWVMWPEPITNPISMTMAETPGGHGILSVDGRIFRSSDKGKTWAEGGTWPFGVNVPLPPFLYAVGEVFITCAWKGTEMMRSTDYGLTWQAVDLPFGGTVIENVVQSRDGRLLALAGDRSLFLCADDGVTWQRIGAIPEPDFLNNVYSYLFLTGEIIIVRNLDYRLYRSTDLGATWATVDFDPYPSTVVKAMLEYDGRIVAAENRGEVFRTTDHGDSWQTRGKITRQIGEGVQTCVRTEQGTLFAGTYGLNGGGIYRSTDDGMTWSPVTIGLFGADSVGSILAAGGDTILAATNNGIFRSSNNGDDWDQSQTGITTNHAYSLVKGPDAAVYAGTGEGVWRSTDNGRTWFDRNNGINDNQIRVMFTTRDGMLLAASGTGQTVYRSTDEGDTWMSATIPAGGNRVAAFAEDSDGVLYAGTYFVFEAANNGFLLRSTDRGETWTIVTYLPINAVLSLLVGSDGHLYGGIAAAGVWRSANPVTSSTPQSTSTVTPQSLTVTGTMVNYSVRRTGRVWLSLHDALGRRIRTLLDAEQQPGEHHLSFDVTDLPSGIYYLRLMTPTGRLTRSLVLLH